MQQLSVLCLVLALAGAGTALAARGDPQKRIVPRDQARAKAMLLRASDLSVAFSSVPNPGGDAGFYCAAIDESDLTVTGEARSPTFKSVAEAVSSTAYVYESKADSDASWRRGTSSAGVSCLRAGLRRQLGGVGVRLLSFKPISFPKRGQRSVAYRLAASLQGVRLFMDVVAVQVSRAQGAIVYLAALAPPPRAELVRLSGLLGRRMQTAMRGA